MTQYIQEEILSKALEEQLRMLAACSRVSASGQVPRTLKMETTTTTSVNAWDTYSKFQYKFHQFVHSHYCATGWTEWKSISVDKCDTTSSTSTKEAS